MSKYTTELRYICETLAQKKASVGYDEVDTIITAAAPKLFTFDFPIFDEEYRQPLEEKFLRHFYTREICAESVGLWKLFLQRKFTEIMPYYIQLYKSAQLEFAPLEDVDYIKTYTKTGEGRNQGTRKGTTDRTSSGTDTSNNATQYDDTVTGDESHDETYSHKDAYSDTPQGTLTGVDSLTYLTNYRDINDKTKGGSKIKNVTDRDITENKSRTTSGTEKETNDEGTTGSFNNKDEYSEQVKGKIGAESKAKLLKEYRETFLNIDMMVFAECEDLFMGVW